MFILAFQRNQTFSAKRYGVRAASHVQVKCAMRLSYKARANQQNSGLFRTVL